MPDAHSSIYSQICMPTTFGYTLGNSAWKFGVFGTCCMRRGRVYINRIGCSVLDNALSEPLIGKGDMHEC
jgi:hypothetical protein